TRLDAQTVSSASKLQRVVEGVGGEGAGLRADLVAREKIDCFEGEVDQYRRGNAGVVAFVFFFSSRRRHTRLVSDWSSDVCSSDLLYPAGDTSGRGYRSSSPPSRARR